MNKNNNIIDFEHNNKQLINNQQINACHNIQNDVPDNHSGLEIDNLSEEMIEAYINAVSEETPDLWKRIEAGFEMEMQNNQTDNQQIYPFEIQQKNKKAKSKKKSPAIRMWSGLAAGILICAIAIPVLVLNNKTKKSEEENRTTSSLFIKQDDSAPKEEIMAEESQPGSCQDNSDSFLNEEYGEDTWFENEEKTEEAEYTDGSNDANEITGNLGEKEPIDFIIEGMVSFDGEQYYIDNYVVKLDKSDNYDLDGDSKIVFTNTKEIQDILLEKEIQVTSETKTSLTVSINSISENNMTILANVVKIKEAK